jgi:hypothetical protein
MAERRTGKSERPQWLAAVEMALDKLLDSLAQRQPFRFGAYTAIDPRGEKAPVLMQAIDNNELRRLLEKTTGKI